MSPTQDATVFNSRCSDDRICAVLQKTSILFSCAMCTGLSHMRIPILMPNPTLCAFRRPVHSHLRRAREGPEQVPHVLEFARVLLGHGADVKAQHDNDRCTPVLSSLARWISRLCSQSFPDTAQIQKHWTITMRTHWSRPVVHYAE